MKSRLDNELVVRGLISTRSQAESFVKLGEVEVNGQVIAKPGFLVSETDKIVLKAKEQYVSRAGLKLASVSKVLKLDFNGKVVLDVGSSTGGFTDYALKHGAKKVIAVEVGKDQLHASLRGNPNIELHEQTDIRDLSLEPRDQNSKLCINVPDIVLIDVSFISLRDILPHISKLITRDSVVVAMVKPQFEAMYSNLKHKGVIKNDRIRRDILKDFELWAQKHFIITAKADSSVSGAKGNLERFYLLAKSNKQYGVSPGRYLPVSSL